MNSEIKTILENTWEHILADGEVDIVFEQLEELKGKADHHQMIKFIINEFGDDPGMIYYFAISGYEESQVYLEKFLKSDDEDDLFFAAIGLAHFERKEAFYILDQFANGTHPLLKHIKPLGDLYPELKYMDNNMAKEMLKKFESGEYD